MQLTVRAIERSATADAASEGEYLADLVRTALERGSAAPVAVVVRPERTELMDLRTVARSRLGLTPFLAGLSRSEVGGLGAPMAVGIAGTFRHRAPASPSDAPPVPVGLAFLEWSDCRWFHWQVLLGTDGQLQEDTELVRSAEAGDPMPSGLGRWWSLGRRRDMRVRYASGLPSAVPVRESPLVH